MKMDVKIDMQKLERSLKNAAKRFGESNQQAVCRWGVQTARELANQTQVYGKTTKAKRTQVDAITASMRAMVTEIKGARARGGSVSGIANGKAVRWPVSRYLASPEDVNRFIDSHRGKNGHTPKRLPIAEKAACSSPVFKKALRLRILTIGAAKGPWLGAGEQIGRAQRGSSQIRIGKNFLGYAQRHARHGRATIPRAGFNPSALLINRARHTGSSYVLKTGAMRTALEWGAKNTMTWYRRSAKEALDKA